MPGLVFLDFDGVLNRRGLDDGITDLTLEPDLVANLNHLVAKSKARVVISSAWRTAAPLPVIVQRLVAAGFAHPRRIIGRTPSMGRGLRARGEEIAEYLRLYCKLHGLKKPPPFVALDDYPMMEPVTDWHVRTLGNQGLTQERAAEALALLTGRAGGMVA